MARTAGTEAATSGTDNTQPNRPEKMSAWAAVNPPNNAMLVPAVRTPINRNRLTMVRGTAEANKKKLLTGGRGYPAPFAHGGGNQPTGTFCEAPDSSQPAGRDS